MLKPHCFAFCLILVSLVAFTLCVNAKPNFSEVFKFENLKDEYKDTKTKVAVTKTTVRNKAPLRIVFISNINLYTTAIAHSIQNIIPDLVNIPFDEANFTNEPFYMVLDDQAKKIISQKLIPAPTENGKILYKHSQLLLQESIRELLHGLEANPVDMVIFGGNQVYSSEQYPAFQEIAQDLIKYKIPYYELWGENESKGTRDLANSIKDRFYLLKTKHTNVLVLDNLTAPVIPKSLPYEATEQYLWLEASLDKLNTKEPGSDLIIVSYKPLEADAKAFINKYKNLNIVSMINFSSGEFTINKGIQVLVSNPSLAWYPCAYGILLRDKYSNYNFELKKVGLEDIQEIARQRLSSRETP